MGFRYTLYRVSHIIKSKLGILKIRHPKNPSLKKFISLDVWKDMDNTFIIEDREKINFEKRPNIALKEKATKILNGEICFFNSQWQNLGKSYNWITNPDTNYTYDITKHWSEICDFNPLNGDIKYVWEKSRFTHLLTLMRYDYHFNDDNAVFVFTEIESWIDANPINQGPNWKCSQEISLRLFNWIYVLTFYKNSSAFSQALWFKIQNVIYWSLHHVYHHINFSRIAVRNNHAITETLLLAISDLLFPFIPETKKWSKFGRKWLEQEVNYQIYDDGTFLQFSMNYNRVLVQLLSFGISITELNKKPFTNTFYTKAYKTLNFLYQCLQKENGYLPNYGANDGALFFPLTENDYRDYRPQLNTLHHILTGKNLFQDIAIQEDCRWVKKVSIPRYDFKILKHEYGTLSFEYGGYFMCRTKNSFTFIRCGNHKDRPSHADNLHIDIWVNGKNILKDSGTYKYNTEKEILNYFTGTKSHNTVTVNDESQMLKGSRFIWYYWTNSLVAKWTQDDDYYIFNGKIRVFRHLNNKGTHNRIVKISKSQTVWYVKDEVINLDQFVKKQMWHYVDGSVFFSSNSNNHSKEISLESNYYGQKKEGKAISFCFARDIETEVIYQK